MISFWLPIAIGGLVARLPTSTLAFQQQQAANARTGTRTLTPSQHHLLNNNKRQGSTTGTQLFNFLDDMVNSVSNAVTPEPDNKETTGTSSSTEDVFSLTTELFDNTEVTMGLEIARDELQAVLERKQAELETKQDAWGQEKTGFVAQIAELTATLTKNTQDKQEDDEVEAEQQDDLQGEQDRLQREIQLLKNQQNQVEQRLVQEKERNDALQTKLDKANDGLEFEQMLYFKDKKKLQAKVAEQQKELQDLAAKLARDETKFGNDQSSLRSKLEQERTALDTWQKEIKQMQREYYQGQDVLKEQLRQEDAAVRDAQREMERERKNLQQEKTQLEASLEQEQANVVNMENAIREETVRFNELKPKLEQTFQEEKLKVDQLSRKLQQEQDRFEMEKTSLEGRIAKEKKRLDVVQYQLKRERTENSQVMKDLTYEQSLIEDQRADDRGRMGQRFAALRAAITERIENEKRQGRKDLKDMALSFETTLYDTEGVIQDMKEQIQSRSKSNSNMQSMVADMKKQVQQVYTDKQQSEMRYQRLIMDRKIEIKGLETNIEELKETSIVRDQEIEKVESSYRAIAKASLKLTGKRLNRINPLRLLRRGKNKNKVKR